MTPQSPAPAPASAPTPAPAPARPSRAGDVRLTLVTPAESADARRSRPAAAAPPLALRAITKRWRANQPPVLDGLELTLEPGTSTWVGGRNGVGKTTLLRIAAGLIHPEQGRVEARGITVHQDRQRYQRLVSLLPAGDRGLYARLTVEQHLHFWARIAMVPAARLRRSVGEAIDRFELGELSSRRVDRLSMGQRQRLRIAMTFLPDPQVVLLDEPLTSLDRDGAELLARATADVQACDGAVLWCSPELAPPDHGFDRSWTLQQGRLVPA